MAWFVLSNNLFFFLWLLLKPQGGGGSVSCEYTIYFSKRTICLFIFKDFIYLFLERWEGRKKERERNINVWEIHQLVASHTPPIRDLACNPGMCPDWESNQWSFGSQASTRSTEPHQSGLKRTIYKELIKKIFFSEASFLNIYHIALTNCKLFGCLVD